MKVRKFLCMLFLLAACANPQKGWVTHKQFIPHHYETAYRSIPAGESCYPSGGKYGGETCYTNYISVPYQEFIDDQWVVEVSTKDPTDYSTKKPQYGTIEVSHAAYDTAKLGDYFDGAKVKKEVG